MENRGQKFINNKIKYIFETSHVQHRGDFIGFNDHRQHHLDTANDHYRMDKVSDSTSKKNHDLPSEK